jgi:hypothetical protein
VSCQNGPGETRLSIPEWSVFCPRWSHKTYLKPDDGQCLHYYVCFIDEDPGLCSVRVPTWCPFRLQFYCNGHSVLARQMTKRNIEYRVLDNAFGWISDFDQAQKLADEFRIEVLHRKRTNSPTATVRW